MFSRILCVWAWWAGLAGAAIPGQSISPSPECGALIKVLSTRSSLDEAKADLEIQQRAKVLGTVARSTADRFVWAALQPNPQIDQAVEPPRYRLLKPAQITELQKAFQQGGDAFVKLAKKFREAGLENSRAADRSLKRRNDILRRAQAKMKEPKRPYRKLNGMLLPFETTKPLRERTTNYLRRFDTEVAKLGEELTSNRGVLLRDLSEVSERADSVDFFLQSQASNLSPREAFEVKLGSMAPELLNALTLYDDESGFSELYRQENGGEYPRLKETLFDALQVPFWRKKIAAVAASILKEQSEAVARKLDRRSSPAKYDLIFKGAGLHEHTAQNYFRQNQTNLTTLTIERKPYVASTFRDGGQAFNLNSSSRREVPDALRQVFGIGDPNFFPGGLVQLSQFSNLKNPPAEFFADAITINRSLSRGLNHELLLEDTIEVVSKNQGGDPLYPYLVKTSGGRTVQAGFKNEISQRYLELTDGGTRTIFGNEPSLGRVGFALQVLGRKNERLDIYQLGPAAASVVDPRELKNNEENSVSNANQAWRVWRMTEALSLRRLAQLSSEGR